MCRPMITPLRQNGPSKCAVPQEHHSVKMNELRENAKARYGADNIFASTTSFWKLLSAAYFWEGSNTFPGVFNAKLEGLVHDPLKDGLPFNKHIQM